MRKTAAALALAALSLAVPARAGDEAPKDLPGFWTEKELALLDQGLQVLNCTRADLGFQKRPIDDPFRLEVVNRVLDDPLSIGPVTAEWDAEARQGNPVRLVQRAAATLGLKAPAAAMADSFALDCPGMEEHLPPSAMDAFALLVSRLAVQDERVSAALEKTGDKRDAFLRKAFRTQVEKSPWPPEPADMKDEELLALAKGRDLAPVLEGGREILEDTAALAKALVVAKTPLGAVRWKGVCEAETPIGRVVLYGHGDDVHALDDDAVLVLDLGGNDTWVRGASASVLRGRPLSVGIDAGGDDRYMGGHELSFGGALGGIAIQWDCGGNDVYHGGHGSLGAGILGVGVLVDEGGDDTYRCKDFGEGAGAFGIGLLLDKGGNDLYHADLYGQGFASTWGCGMLVEMAGQDVYDAGGVHLHEPLFRDRHQSLSQGFSIGMRPDASGGVGVLVDLAGNDRYACDIYGQGAAYWYALGILIDDDGNDTYCLGQYGQGSGIHLAAGILFDRAGQDLYYDMHGVGQGGAHDFSVGFLVDRAGDDYYAGSGGTQGGALTNSVAVLLDGAGNDAYAAAKIDFAQGSASPARNTGGIGLLLDGGGRDLYSELARDGAAWTKDLFGAGLDDPAPPEASTAGPGEAGITAEAAAALVEKEGTVPGPGGKPAFDLDRLWAIAIRWEVGENRVVVPIARERLVALGAPARDRALERVGSKDGLEYRAVETTLAKFPAEEVVPRLLERTRDRDPLVRKGAIMALASLGAAAAVDRFVEMLATEPDSLNRAKVLGALGTLKKAPPAVKGFLRSPRELEGVAAATCLAGVGDAAAIGALADSLGPDAAFLVRVAALDRLASLGDAAVPAMARLAADTGAPTMARRNALRVLGRSKSAAAAEGIGAALLAEDRWLRFSAMEAAADLAKGLGGKEGAGIAARLAAARAEETDPLVRGLR